MFIYSEWNNLFLIMSIIFIKLFSNIFMNEIMCSCVYLLLDFTEFSLIG